MIILADTVVNKVFYKIDYGRYPGVSGVQPGVDPYRGVAEIVGITNMVVSFAAPIAILMLVIGAIMYITAGGEEEKMGKAKRVIIMAAIGIVIIYGAFALVSTFISGSFGEAELPEV